MQDRPTALSQALNFLHRDFEPHCYYWELVEAGKKLFLVGFATAIWPGTMYQLMIAFMVSSVHMLFMAIYQPFRSIDNDYFTLACNFSLTSIFFFCVLLKVPVTSSLPLLPAPALPHLLSDSPPTVQVDVLTDAVDDVMTDSLRERFGMQTAVLSVGLGGAILFCIVLVSVTSLQQVFAALREPIIRVKETRASPKLTLTITQKWHLFLSQCAARFEHNVSNALP